jgi:hypothetical protein
LLQASLEIRVDLFSHCVQLIQQVFVRIDPQDHRPRVIPFRYEERRLSKVRFVEEFPRLFFAVVASTDLGSFKLGVGI